MRSRVEALQASSSAGITTGTEAATLPTLTGVFRLGDHHHRDAQIPAGRDNLNGGVLDGHRTSSHFRCIKILDRNTSRASASVIVGF